MEIQDKMHSDEVRNDSIEMSSTVKQAAEYLADYWSTYMNQPGASNYSSSIVLDDMLYGIGVALDKKYQFASGYTQFKKDLAKHLSAITQQCTGNEISMSPNMIDQMSEAEAKNLLNEISNTFNIGGKAKTASVILTNVKNAAKDAFCSNREDAKRYRFLRNEDSWGEDEGDDWGALGEAHAGEFDCIVDLRMDMSKSAEDA